LTTFETWKAARQKCRTELQYLCRVLGYNDVSDRVHGQLIANLQSFKGGVDAVEIKQMPNLKEGEAALPSVDAIIAGYKPIVPDFWDLDGARNRLNMIPRGHLKTTIVTFAHTIQWIINYPDIRILLYTHTDGRGKEFMSEIRKKFTDCDSFRYLFPEHVPWGKEANEFGNQEFFDTKARRKWVKEHTCSYLTTNSAKSGGHWDVVKADDAVDSTTVITPGAIETTRKEFGAVGPLVETHAHAVRGEMSGWRDLTGTFYDFSDLNYSTYETEKEKPEDKRIWSLNVQSAVTNGLNLDDPDATFLWPERCGRKKLKEIEDDPTQGPGVLASQYLMNPIPPGAGLIESQDEIIWMPRKELEENYARHSLYVAVDLAGMEQSKKNSDNDFTAITLGGFKNGHLYIHSIYHGRPNPQQVIEEMFSLYKRHPRISRFKIEKEAHARVLLPFLKAEESKRDIWLPIMEITRDNQQSKQQKIRGLQPWFKRGMIHFANDLPCKMAIINEIMRFPKFNHDDILDTIYDLMSDKEGRATHEVMVDDPKDWSRENQEPDYEAAIYGQQNEEMFTSEAVMGW
jgi:predicted phage terminase large subunit-like protein